MSDAVRLPASVHAYLTDRAIETAVDHLLGKGGARLPDNLDWSELQEFTAARSAALQTKHDFALVLEQAWLNVWSRRLRHADFLSVDEQLDFDPAANPHPDAAWEEWCWFRLHRGAAEKRRIGYSAIYLSAEGLQIGVGALDARCRPLIAELPGYAYDRDNQMCWSDVLAPIAVDGSIDVAVLAPLADLAVERLAAAGA